MKTYQYKLNFHISLEDSNLEAVELLIDDFITSLGKIGEFEGAVHTFKEVPEDSLE